MNKIQMFGTNPFIRFKEGSTDNAVIQWHSDGHIRSLIKRIVHNY